MRSNVGVKGQNVTKDIASSLSNFQVLNPEQLICELDKNAVFEMELTISKGRGYVSAEDNQKDDLSIGQLLLTCFYPN